MQYQLREVLVDPTDLLLDPSNPRLRKDAGPAREYSDAEIAAPEMQDRLFRAICGKEHEVKELSDSIKLGFPRKSGPQPRPTMRPA